jgi:hypothetical protein
MTVPHSMRGAVGAVRISLPRTCRRAHIARLRFQQSLYGAVGAVAQWNFRACHRTSLHCASYMESAIGRSEPTAC